MTSQLNSQKNCNTHIDQYLQNSRQLGNKTGSINRITRETLFVKNHTQNEVKKLLPDPFLKIKIEHISESVA